MLYIYRKDKPIDEREDISREAFELRRFRNEVYTMIQGDPEDLLMIDQRAEYLEAVEEYQIAVEDFIDNFRFYLEDWEIQIWEQKIDKTRNAVGRVHCKYE